MTILKQKKLPVVAILKLIEEAKNAELCHDLESSRKLLEPFWEDLEAEPRFADGTEEVLKAEILRLAGFFLSCWGRAKNVCNFQERGKNLLTAAIEIFDAENLPHKSAEARVMLALCYFYEGAFDESETVLSDAESEYADNQLHPVYLKICVNRLMVNYRNEDFQAAFVMLEKMKTAMDFCSDERLLVKYHNQAGIINRVVGKPDEAFFHFKNAIHFSRRAKIDRYEALNLNNLGNLCKDIGDYAAAHLHTDRSLEIFARLKQEGWAAHVRDTKATIFLLENKLPEALAEINLALDIFRAGEDYAGLTDALFNRARIYLKSSELKDALLDLSEAIRIARVRTSETAAEKYADAFARLLYPKKNLDYASEIRAFKKSLLEDAFRRNDLQVNRTAKDLGVSHQNLSKILAEQFSELYDELGIERRPRTVKNRSHSVTLTKVFTESRTRHIQILNINHEDFVLPKSLSENLSGKFFSFVMSARWLPEIDRSGDVIVLTAELTEPEDCRIVAQDRMTREIRVLNLGYDDFTRIYYLKDAIADSVMEPVDLDGFIVYGQIVAYQMLEKVEGKRIYFKAFA